MARLEQGRRSAPALGTGCKEPCSRGQALSGTPNPASPCWCDRAAGGQGNLLGQAFPNASRTHVISNLARSCWDGASAKKVSGLFIKIWVGAVYPRW